MPSFLPKMPKDYLLIAVYLVHFANVKCGERGPEEVLFEVDLQFAKCPGSKMHLQMHPFDRSKFSCANADVENGGAVEGPQQQQSIGVSEVHFFAEFYCGRLYSELVAVRGSQARFKVMGRGGQITGVVYGGQKFRIGYSKECSLNLGIYRPEAKLFEIRERQEAGWKKGFISLNVYKHLPEETELPPLFKIRVALSKKCKAHIELLGNKAREYPTQICELAKVHNPFHKVSDEVIAMTDVLRDRSGTPTQFRQLSLWEARRGLADQKLAAIKGLLNGTNDETAMKVWNWMDELDEHGLIISERNNELRNQFGMSARQFRELKEKVQQMEEHFQIDGKTVEFFTVGEMLHTGGEGAERKKWRPLASWSPKRKAG